jgi:hypothetical protein
MRTRVFPYVMGLVFLFSNAATAQNTAPPEEFRILAHQNSENAPPIYLGLTADHKLCAQTIGTLFATSASLKKTTGMCISTQNPLHIFQVNCTKAAQANGSIRTECLLAEENLTDVAIGYAPGSARKSQLVPFSRLTHGDL